MTATVERLWARVDGTSECWEWTGYVNENGYGVITDETHRKHYVHRVAWESVNGRVPVGMILLHSCDNRRCCRPDHLRVGTRRENSADMVAKGRSQRGEKHTQAVLTQAEVDEIRRLLSMGLTQQAVAETFGISRAAVGLIGQRKRWAATREEA